jgi:DNA-binding LytR/AlgR family response regulator
LNTRLKCLLLDDELPSLTYLKMLCEQIPELEVIRAFNNAESFLAGINEIEFDLCILDIEIPGFNGLQLAALLDGKPVIFTTAYSEYAAEAFDVDAIDYILKPVKPDRLQQAVKKAIKQAENGFLSKPFTRLNTEKGKTLVYFDKLNYLRTSEIDSRDKIAQMKDGSEIIIKNISFQSLLRLLPQGLVCRINKKEVIALGCVQFFSHDRITTNIRRPDGKPLELDLSEIYRNDFIRLVSP